MRHILLTLLIMVCHSLGLKAQEIKPDSTFNSIGFTILETGYTDNCTSSVLQPDGKLILCGWTAEEGEDLDALIIRLLPDGTLDHSFGNEGTVQLDYQNHTDRFNAIALQADGRIVITGSVSNKNFPQEYDFATLRLNADGSVDSTFGNGGRVITDLGTDNEFASAIVIQPDGKILAAGRSDDSLLLGHSDFAMVRYLPNGSPDSLFGNNGIVQTTFFNVLTWDEAHSIALFPDGKILLGGYAENRQLFGLAKYDPDGSIDSTFGEDGLVTTDFGFLRSGGIKTLQITEDGGILAGGYVANVEFPWKGYIGIAKYQLNGEPDPEFGVNGISKISIGEQCSIGGMKLLSDGNIVLGGSSNIAGETQEDWLVARLTPNGKLDPSFDEEGYMTQMMGVGPGYATQLLIQPDNKIILTGLSSNPRNIAAARFVAEETTAIHYTNAFEPFQISPNPSHGNFQIELGNNQSGGLQICIYTMMGAQVFKKNMSGNLESKFEIETSHLESGNYILQLRNDKYYQMQKLIIQK